VIGQTIAHYRVSAKLGAGGMGEVYRGHDEQLDRDVALKVLPAGSFSDPAARARLLREARSAAALNHPNICTIHEVGEAGGQAYIAMELVEGQPLSTRLTQGPLKSEQALRYGAQIADALSHAHERQIIHRDLKSGNVVITPEGRAKVLDFGLAKRLSGDEMDEVTRSQASLTAPGAIVGTLAYMAPEQLRGEPADARSDIWALGVVLYEMAAGSRPFRGQTGFALSSAILNQAPAPLPAGVAAPLRAVIERCLEKDPRRRYQRAREVRAALEAAEKGTTPVWQGMPGRVARRAVVAGAALALLGMLAVGLNVGGLRTRLLGGVAGPKFDSLAVLPLENLSGDPEQDYLAAGMHEALIIDLGRLSGLRRVSARQSTLRYEKSDKQLRQIAEELGVAALVTGTVMRSGNKVRITAHLINPATEERLWAESYEREVRDVLALQNEIVAAIAREVRLQLSPREQAGLARARQVNPEAYEAYLKGMFHLRKSTTEEFQKGMALLQQAAEIDPREPLAHAGLAQGYTLMELFSPVRPPDAVLRAQAAALKALALDDTLAEAHAALAYFKFYKEWDYAGAEQSFRRALELNPNLAEPHMFYGFFLGGVLGRYEESLAVAKRGAELDPLSPLFTAWVGAVYWEQGKDEEAIAQAQKALDLVPDFPVALFVLGLANSGLGRHDDAIATMQRAASKYPNQNLTWGLAWAYGRAGRTAEARKLLAPLESGAPPGDATDPWFIAGAYVGLREHDKAMAWLEKAYKSRHMFLPTLKHERMFKPLHNHPRFQDLLRRLNLPQ
jgi:TolB-like protein/Tfp pilus assembly protein PilF